MKSLSLSVCVFAYFVGVFISEFVIVCVSVLVFRLHVCALVFCECANVVVCSYFVLHVCLYFVSLSFPLC